MQSWALVTGATVGIGESFTRLLAHNGYNIVLVARDLPRLQERAKGLESSFGIETKVIQADLATDAGCKSIEDFIINNHIDVLINNAGFGLNKAFTQSQLEAEQQMLDVLVRTPMRLMHVALPAMKERNKGVIINVSSVAGWIAGGTYSASKSYLTVLTESLHTELASTNVKVSALCPGFTRTEFHQRGGMSMKGLPAFMWLNADKLVATAWKDAVAGKAVSVPGWQYQLLTFVMRNAPRPLVRKIGMNVRIKQRKK
ncbi:very-long-chain 3-oxoacyl-CoA reductase [Actinomycetota bacterium]|nr:very-long-chain 3-oxoacyl-CoA reductase [Actinomycetota bacterium]